MPTISKKKVWNLFPSIDCSSLHLLQFLPFSTSSFPQQRVRSRPASSQHQHSSNTRWLTWTISNLDLFAIRMTTNILGALTSNFVAPIFNVSLFPPFCPSNFLASSTSIPIAVSFTQCVAEGTQTWRLTPHPVFKGPIIIITHMHPDKQANKPSENVAKGTNLDRETQSLRQRKKRDGGS